MLLYYITDRRQWPGSAAERRERLLRTIAAAASAGVDYIQLREKDLEAGELEALAHAAVQAVRSAGSPTRLLINSRLDIALAAGTDGVHLRADDLPAGAARRVLMQAWAAAAALPVIGVSCHSEYEVALAESEGADFAVFGPVFGKSDGAPPAGVPALRQVCRRRRAASPPMPVLALGGIAPENAAQALRAGAAGLAGIRLFQDLPAEALSARVRQLRALEPAPPKT